ncbi:MAG: FtsX-like permease family protein [Candidatus Thorarchaeota archaeon]|nr:MAG: FtsX-like permease family protein [Candidatus Thorarchaeota archaeon]
MKQGDLKTVVAGILPQRGETLTRRNGGNPRIAKGSRLYAFSYALSSMKSHPFRALSLALTLSLGVSLIGSVLIWADTGVSESVDNYFDTNAFQMLVSNPAGSTHQVDLAQSYALSSNLVERVYRVNSTVGLVSGTQLPDSTQYGLDEPIYTEDMKDCEVIFVNNDFLDYIAPEFEYEGEFRLSEGEVLVSSQFVIYYHQVFDLAITVNSTIDIELLTRRPQDIVGYIGNMNRQSITSLRVVGIYDVGPYGSLLQTGFPSRMRSNYDYLNYDTAVLGILDSVMILSEGLDLQDLPEVGFFGARTFIRASGEALIAAGVDNIASNLLTLKARLDEQYSVTVDGLSEILTLQDLVDTYASTMPLALLNLPVFIIALFLSVFAADTFMAARTVEVSALRSKGASSTQVYGIFLSESALMASFSFIIGIVLSVLFAPLIPSAISFMTFDLEIYSFFLERTVLKMETIVYSFLICILPPLLFILNSARKAANAEISSIMMETSETPPTGGEAHGFTLGASAVLLSMTVGSVIFLPNDPFVMILELIFGTAAWFFLAYNGSRFSRVGFARLTAKLSFVLGEKNLVAAGNLRMRRGRIVPLMVVLALTLSSTITFTVQAESYQSDLEAEVKYALGADLRVGTTGQPFSFNDTLEAYPGVNRAVPVLRTWGQVGNERITLVATDAVEYSLIGNFHESSFFGESPSIVLSRLAAVPNGIILSAYHAERWNKTIGDTLGLDAGGRISTVQGDFVITGLVFSAPGFGYAAAADIPSARLGAGFGFQSAYSGFAITNLGFMSLLTDRSSTDTFLADMVCVTDQEFLLRALSDLPGVTATTPEHFDLRGFSFGTALFLSTIEGLFSIGFAMSLILSLFALTLFLGSIVRERRRDYAILRAVGGSRQQVVNMVLSEFTGIVFASLTLSLVLGTIFGFVMSTVVFSLSPFARTLQAAITFPIGFLTGVLLIEVLAMIMGAYLPAREASKTDPAIVLRNL